MTRVLDGRLLMELGVVIVLLKLHSFGNKIHLIFRVIVAVEKDITKGYTSDGWLSLVI